MKKLVVDEKKRCLLPARYHEDQVFYNVYNDNQSNISKAKTIGKKMSVFVEMSAF